jgi:hypothetical protein
MDNGNQFPTGLSLEEYLDHARRTNNDNKRDTSFISNVRGPIPNNEADLERADSSTETDVPGSSDDDEVAGNSLPSGLAGGKSSGKDDKRPPGYHPGLHQHDRPSQFPIAAKSAAIRDGLKTVLKPVRQVLKEHKEQKSDKPLPKLKVLTDAEILKLRPRLTKFIEWSSDHMDEFIAATTKSHASVVIWSDLDSDDIEVLVDYMLSRGKESARAAELVRKTSVFMDKIKTYLIVTPRMYKTASTYLQRGLDIRLRM